MQERPSDEMLLDFVRDGLAPADAREVAALAETDLALAAEIAALRAVREAAQGPGEIAWSNELGWARLAAEIKREQVPAGAATGWKVACMVLGVLCIGQVVLGLGSRDRDPARGYELAEAATDRPVLRVIFREDARESEMRELVQDAAGEIVGGPSIQAFYDMGFTDAAARDAAQAVFTRRSDLVQHVEAAGPR